VRSKAGSLASLVYRTTQNKEEEITKVVTMALSRVVSEIFNVEKYRDLEIPVKGQSRSLKVVSFAFDRLDMVSY